MNTLIWSSNEGAKNLLALSIFTAMRHLGALERIVVLTGYFGEDMKDLGLSKESMELIHALVLAFNRDVHVEFIDCTSLYYASLAGVNDDTLYSKFASLRLLVPLLGLECDACSNFVYLDVDTLILRDFSYVWDECIADFDILAGEQCRGYCVHEGNKFFVGVLRNSAVIVLNSDLSEDRLGRYFKCYKMFKRVKLVLPDVQVINACLLHGGYDQWGLKVYEVDKESLDEHFGTYDVDILHYTTEHLKRYYVDTLSRHAFSFYLTSGNHTIIRNSCLDFKYFCSINGISVSVVVESDSRVEGDF